MCVAEMVTTAHAQNKIRLEKNVPIRKIQGNSIIFVSLEFVDYYIDGHVTVTHITAHTNHQPGHHEDKYLPLPKSVKDEMAIKLSNGIPAERIMEGTHCSPYSIYS